MARDADGKVIKVGDWVSFKSDVEQSGRVTKIVGDQVYLENNGGFDGGYIGGQTTHVEEADRCWVE